MHAIYLNWQSSKFLFFCLCLLLVLCGQCCSIFPEITYQSDIVSSFQINFWMHCSFLYPGSCHCSCWLFNYFTVPEERFLFFCGKTWLSPGVYNNTNLWLSSKFCVNVFHKFELRGEEGNFPVHYVKGERLLCIFWGSLCLYCPCHGFSPWLSLTTSPFTDDRAKHRLDASKWLPPITHCTLILLVALSAPNFLACPGLAIVTVCL